MRVPAAGRLRIIIRYFILHIGGIHNNFYFFKEIKFKINTMRSDNNKNFRSADPIMDDEESSSEDDLRVYHSFDQLLPPANQIIHRPLNLEIAVKSIYPQPFVYILIISITDIAPLPSLTLIMCIPMREHVRRPSCHNTPPSQRRVAHSCNTTWRIGRIWCIRNCHLLTWGSCHEMVHECTLRLF
jgi:hypothetical protein